MAPAQCILVTGGAGFIGSHVAVHLASTYPSYRIIVFDKLEYCSSLSNLAQIANQPNFEFIKGNVCSAEFVNYILTEKRVDVILHLAAQSHVDNSFGDSLEFTRNNVYGTHVLLEAARVHNIKRFIHVSTDEVYGEAGRGQAEMDEASILAPSNPYAATKAAAECLVMAYHKSFGLPVIITRSNNVYGPCQYPEKIIPKFICSILRGKPCYIHGNGTNSRRYVYATDIAEALAIILHTGTPGETYNIGSDYEISNIALARLLLKHFDINDDTGGRDGSETSSSSLVFVEDRAFNDRRYAIDSSKLRALGWTPRVPFEQGIVKTIQWYRDHSDNWWCDDIASALIAHPSRKFPPLQFPSKN